MHILSVHNRYQERGGEDVVFESEAALLERFGHTVRRLVFDNTMIPPHRSPRASVGLAVSTIWSRAAATEVRDAVREAQADVVHFHNTFPLISPAALAACRHEGVAIVQTLHNYRLLCPSAILFRDGHICEDCLGRTLPWPGIAHACYRSSRLQTAVTASMLAVHRLRRTWHRDVDLFIALTEFARQKFVAGGLPPERIVVKPNFVDPDPAPKREDGAFVLFVGRLTDDKGVRTLVSAWSQRPALPPLRIVGDGPLAPWVAGVAAGCANISLLGRLARVDVIEQMHLARALVFPSEWYEGFGVAIAEAFACGLPVIAARQGAMAEIVDDGRTGLLFSPGNPESLARTVERAWSCPEDLRQMGSAARNEYEQNYTAEINYERLIALYERAIAVAQQRRTGSIAD